MAIKLKKFAFGPSSSSGFSLIEILVVISVVSILSLLALPNLKHFFQEQQLNQATRALMTRIRVTRIQAMKKQSKQVLTWKSEGAVTIRFNASFKRNKNLTFLPSGFTQGQQGSFYLCLKNKPDQCRRIVILTSGVARLSIG